MTFLATAGQYLATWVGRAGQAYDSGTWGSGTLWSTHYNNAIASRDYWQHTVAHNDANVWDNRYNAGYSAGDSAGYTRGYNTGYSAGAASKTTTYQTSTAWQGITNDGQGGEHWSNDRIGIAANRTGLAQVSIWVGVGTDGSSVYRRLRILRNGGVVVEGPNIDNASGGIAMAHAILNLNSGDNITVQCLLNGSRAHYNGACEMFMTTGNV